MRRADFDTQDTMRHILDFKAGRKYATKWAADLVARTLAPMDLTNTIIVCIPASCEQTNKRRYKRFSASVCEKCKAINGFEHIQVKASVRKCISARSTTSRQQAMYR